MKRRNFLTGLLAAPFGAYAAAQIEVLPKVVEKKKTIVWEHFDPSENTFNFQAVIQGRRYFHTVSGEVAEDLFACHEIQAGEPFLKWVELMTKNSAVTCHSKTVLPHYKQNEYQVKMKIDKITARTSPNDNLRSYQIDQFNMTVNSTRPGDVPYLATWYGNPHWEKSFGHKPPNEK